MASPNARAVIWGGRGTRECERSAGSMVPVQTLRPCTRPPFLAASPIPYRYRALTKRTTPQLPLTRTLVDRKARSCSVSPVVRATDESWKPLRGRRIGQAPSAGPPPGAPQHQGLLHIRVCRASDNPSSSDSMSHQDSHTLRLARYPPGVQSRRRDMDDCACMGVGPYSR